MQTNKIQEEIIAEFEVFDNWLDKLISSGSDIDSQELYAAVAWTFWCVNLRSNNIAQVPYLVYPLEVEEKDETEENAVEWPIDLKQILWDVEAWLSLVAAAYVLKRSNGAMLDKLQVLNANTMSVKAYNDAGPLTFEQRVGQIDPCVQHRSHAPR